MIPRVIDAKYMKDCTLYLRFPDGSEGEVDFSIKPAASAVSGWAEPWTIFYNPKSKI